MPTPPDLNNLPARRSLAIRVAALLPLLITTPLAIYTLAYAWPTFAFLRPQRLIDSYHFGSEAIVGHGGWPYRSAATYGWYSFGWGIGLTLTVALLWRAFRRPSPRPLVAGYGLLTGLVLLGLVLDRLLDP